MPKADNPRAVAGDNSGPVSLSTQQARDQLKSIIERIERLQEEKQATADEIRDVYAESKGNGFDVKVLRAIVRARKQDPAEREEFETIFDLYANALGIFA